MLDALRNIVIARVQQRVAEGDCPTIPAETVETLENVICDLIGLAIPRANCFGIPDAINGLPVKQGPDDIFYVEKPDGSGERLVEASNWQDLADLIAAAPDMLEALRRYADQFCEFAVNAEVCGRLGDDACSGCKARAVIAKIGGAA